MDLWNLYFQMLSALQSIMQILSKVYTKQYDKHEIRKKREYFDKYTYKHSNTN